MTRSQDWRSRAKRNMIRKAFLMKVDPERHEEYKKRHSPIWAELKAVLKEHGANNYSIYLEPKSSSLFGYVEVEDEAKWNAISSTPICKKWWAHMKEIMPSNPDNSPVSIDLEEVFHLA